MTKKELLEQIDNSILKNDVLLEGYYIKYYPQLKDLLYIVPAKTKLKYRDGHEPVAIAEFPKDFDAFCRSCTNALKHFPPANNASAIPEIERFFLDLIGSLKEWLSSFSDDLIKLSSIRFGVSERRAKRRKGVAVFLILLGIASVIATVFAILEVYEVGGIGGGKIGSIIGAVGFSVDVLAFVVERIMDMRASTNLENDIVRVLNGEELKMDEFEKKYQIVIKNNNIACCGSQINNH